MGSLIARLSGSKFVRDTAWSFGIKIVSRAVGFAVAVVLARMLGDAGYGIYSYAFALVTLLALPAQFGFPVLLTRETAKGMASDRHDLIRGVWTWAGRATGILSVVLVGGAVIVLFVLNGGSLDEQALTMMWAFLLVPFVALGALRGAALRGLDRIIAGQIPEELIRPTLLLALAGGYGLVTGGLNPPQAMAAHVIAAAAAFVVGAYLLVRHTPDRVRTSASQSDSRSWLKSSVPLALIAGLATINAQADILILGIFDSPDQVGIYRVAVQVALLAAFGLHAINVVIAPRIARLYALREMHSLQRLITWTSRAATAFSIVVAVVFVAIGQQLLAFIFGDEFTDAYAPLVILLVGQVVFATVGSVGHLLEMTGHERDSLNAIGVAVALNVGLNFALIPSLGVVGAAIATATSLAVRNLWLWAFVRRRIGINSLAFGPSPLDRAEK